MILTSLLVQNIFLNRMWNSATEVILFKFHVLFLVTERYFSVKSTLQPHLPLNRHIQDATLHKQLCLHAELTGCLSSQKPLKYINILPHSCFIALFCTNKDTGKSCSLREMITIMKGYALGRRRTYLESDFFSFNSKQLGVLLFCVIVLFFPPFAMIHYAINLTTPMIYNLCCFFFFLICFFLEFCFYWYYTQHCHIGQTFSKNHHKNLLMLASYIQENICQISLEIAFTYYSVAVLFSDIHACGCFWTH